MKLELENITLSELQPAEYNPRQIDDNELRKLTNNLEEFGLVDPIIIDLSDNNTIIGGHQRFKVLENKHLPDDNLNLIKLGDVGWVFEDTELRIKDKNHQKALNLSLNRISGEWQYNKLSHLLSDLGNDNFNIELTGFDDIELSSFNIEEKVQLDNTIFDENCFDKPRDYNNNEDDEELINTDEIKQHKCPKCGHEW